MPSSRRVSFVLALVVSGLIGVGCRKQSSAVGGASASAAPIDSAVYGPAVLQARTCPAVDSDAPTPPPMVDVGCESCKPDEHCKVTSIRGRQIGECARSTCQKDADCPGGLCGCGPPNECIIGNCRGPADCGGRECVPDRWRYGHGRGQFCRTAADTCRTHADCGTGKECAYAGAWKCRTEVPAPPPG